MRLIGIFVIFGFYAIGAIAKMLANRSKTDDGEKSETSAAIELAKKYARQRQLKQQARPASTKRNEFVSDWDRLQEMKRQRLAQHRGLEKMPRQQPQTEPVAMVPVQKQPPPMPPVSQQVPKYQELNRVMQAAQQKKVIRRQSTSSVKQTYKKVAKPVKSQKMPVDKMTKTPRALDVLLRHPNQLRSAIILKEILDKPIAMRETF